MNNSHSEAPRNALREHSIIPNRVTGGVRNVSSRPRSARGVLLLMTLMTFLSEKYKKVKYINKGSRGIEKFVISVIREWKKLGIRLVMSFSAGKETRHETP